MTSRENAAFDDCLERRLRGETVPFDALLLAHPELDDVERARLRALCDSLELPAADVADPSGLPGRIGAYRILRELGRGGQGVVYLAVDDRLARTVAVKVLTHAPVQPGGHRGAPGRDGVARLRREAEAASRLNHPGICVIHELVMDVDVSFIAMRHVEGEPLSRRIARARESASRPDRHAVMASLGLIERAALALNAAHEAGVVHRDIKPGNIMVTPAGDPVLLDFGLAQDAGSATENLTQTGDVFGTPAYMSPEQITPSLGRPDRRTDVYSLGVTLYECLTLRRPFEAPTREKLHRLILDGVVPDARHLNPAVTRDMQVVVQTTLERNRDRRYQTALDLAEDLRRIREREPIRARPAGPLLRVGRWVQRNRVLAMAILGLIVTLATGLCLAVYHLDRMTGERVVSERERRKGDGKRLLAQSSSTLGSDPGLAVLLALEGSERAPGLDANNSIYAALGALHERRMVRAHERYMYACAFSPDGRWLVTASEDRTAKVWEAATGAFLGLLDGHTDEVTAVTFSANGSRLATSSRDGIVRVWETGRWNCAFGVPGQSASPRTTNFDPLSRRLLTASLDGRARLWNAVTGELLGELEGGGRLFVAAFSPDGSRAVTVAGGDQERTPALMRVWDVSTNEAVLLHDLHCANPPDGGENLFFTPSGDQVLVNGPQREACLLDLATADRRRVDTGGVAVSALDFSPDRTLMAIGLDDGGVGFAGLEDPAPVRRLGQHEGRVLHAFFSDDGARLLTDSADDVARIWDVARERLTGTLAAPLREIVGARFDADDRGLFTACGDGTLRWWNVNSEAERTTVAAGAAPLISVDFDREGRRVTAATADGHVGVVDLGNPAAALDLALFAGPNRLAGATFSPDGRALLVAAFTDGASLWDAASGTSLLRFADPSQTGTSVWDARFSPDGTRVVTAAENHEACVWDASSGRLLDRLRGHVQGVRSAAWSGDGRRIVTTSENVEDGSVRVWDAESGEPIAVLNSPHDEGALPIVARMNYDGTRVVAACWDHVARIWEVEQRTRPPLRLTGHRWQLNAVDMSPDGERIVTSALDRTVRVWDGRTGAELATLTPGRGLGAHGVAFSPDGSRIVSAWSDGMLRTWPVHPIAAARERLQRELTAEERLRHQIEEPARH